MKIQINLELKLESITRESTEALYPLFCEDIGELNRWFGFDTDYRIENDYRYLEMRKPPYDDTIVIFYQDTPCGRFGLYDYNCEEGLVFLYYWVSSRFRRRGIGLSCMKAMLQYLKDLDIKEVCFDVDEANEASIRLLEKLPEIRMKSKERHLIYSCLLQEDQNCPKAVTRQK